jgi:hypothetical protein
MFRNLFALYAKLMQNFNPSKDMEMQEFNDIAK